ASEKSAPRFSGSATYMATERSATEQQKPKVGWQAKSGGPFPPEAEKAIGARAREGEEEEEEKEGEEEEEEEEKESGRLVSYSHHTMVIIIIEPQAQAEAHPLKCAFVYLQT
ncbi:unnamed protein product, partial [Prorocentrum cordatum]